MFDTVISQPVFLKEYVKQLFINLILLLTYISMEKMTKLLRVRTRRRLLTYLLIILSGSYVITLFSRLRCTDVYRNTRKRISRYGFNVPDDVTCYHRKQIIDELRFIKSNAIYMFSASCDNFLSAHQACVIESVMQAHGYEKHVYVFFTTPVEECLCSEALIHGLTEIDRLHFIAIQIDKFVEDTPLKDIFRGKFLNVGLEKEARVIEYLKFAALYKFRGIVLDLNMIMAKPVYYLGMNWGARVSDSRLGSAAVALNRNTPIGKSLIRRTLELLREQKSSEVIDGGLALSEAFRHLCYDRPVNGCPNFKIYGEELFYPINQSSSEMIFEAGDLQAKSYGYYVWDRTLARHKQGSLYVKLMREYCPNVAGYMNI